MIRRAAAVALVFGLGILFGTAAGAAAKSGIVARLDSPLPTHARSGTELKIGWTVTVPGSSGLTGTDTVVRLYPANGGATSDWPAQQDRGNHFVATVTVPSGGIETIGIGIPGMSCTESACVPAVAFFTVIDPSGAPVLRPGIQAPTTSTSPVARQTGTDPPVALVVAILLGSMWLAGVLWRLRRAV
jgi:hypothetical protein